MRLAAWKLATGLYSFGMCHRADQIRRQIAGVALSHWSYGAHNPVKFAKQENRVFMKITSQYNKLLMANPVSQGRREQPGYHRQQGRYRDCAVRVGVVDMNAPTLLSLQ